MLFGWSASGKEINQPGYVDPYIYAGYINDYPALLARQPAQSESRFRSRTIAFTPVRVDVSHSTFTALARRTAAFCWLVALLRLRSGCFRFAFTPWLP